MNKSSKKFIALLAVCCMATTAGALAACDKKDSASVDTPPPVVSNPVENDEIYEIYKLYVAAAGENAQSYEKWLETIKGDPGQAGSNGISVTNAELVDGELVLSFSDGTTKNVGKVVGADGKDGVSITEVKLNDDGELVIYFSNETSTNLGVITSGNGAAVSHVHQLGDVIVLKAPTGLEDGAGCKVCSEDGEMVFVSIPKLEGVIVENPLEITFGEATEIIPNTYDSNRYGVDPDLGEKGTVWLQIPVTQGGWFSVISDIDASASVTYKYYSIDSDGEISEMSSRYIYAYQVEEGPKNIIVKMSFSGNYAEKINVTPRIANLPTDVEDPHYGLAEHTITLSKGTAEGIIVHGEYGDAVLTEGVNYTPFNGGDTATVWVDPGKYTFEIVGLEEGYFVKDSTELVFEFDDDGSDDEGGAHAVEVGGSYEYSFTVLNAEGEAIEGANVTISEYGWVESKWGPSWDIVDTPATYKTDADGVVTVTLTERTIDGELMFPYTYIVSNVGFGNKEITETELVPADDAATDYAKILQLESVTIETWQLDTPNEINSAEHYATVEITEAGKYIVEVTAADMSDASWVYYGPGLTLNGEVQWNMHDWQGNTSAVVDLDVGALEIVVVADPWDFDYYGCFYVTVKAAQPTPEGEIVLGEKMSVKTLTEYSYFVSSAGTYQLTITSDMVNTLAMYSSYDAANADTGCFDAEIYFNKSAVGDVYTATYTFGVADELVLCLREFDDDEATITLQLIKLPTAVESDASTTITLYDTYTFTASEDGEYKLTVVTDSMDTRVYYTVADGAEKLYDCADDYNDSIDPVIKFTLKAGETFVYYITGVEGWGEPTLVSATVSKGVAEEGGSEEDGSEEVEDNTVAKS